MTDTTPDLFWTASFWIGTATLVATLLFLLLLFVLKIATQRRQQQAQAFEAAWQPWLLRVALQGMSDAPRPALQGQDAWRLIKLWVRLQMSLRGEANERLRLLGQTLGLDTVAQKLIHSRHRSEQIFGILTLGHMRNASDWHALENLLTQPSNSLAAYAGWALLQISPQKAAPLVLEQLVKRQDIDLLRASSLFKPFRQYLHAPLAKLIGLAHAPAANVQQNDPRAWLLRIGYAIGLPLPGTDLRMLLARGQPMDVIIGALRLLKNAEARDAVRELVTHPDWQVRTQVAITLGRICDASDVERLTTLLTDTQWWVRYRAAQSLASLPFMNHDDLKARMSHLSDRYANDIVKQVFAEMESQA